MDKILNWRWLSFAFITILFLRLGGFISNFWTGLGIIGVIIFLVLIQQLPNYSKQATIIFIVWLLFWFGYPALKNSFPMLFKALGKKSQYRELLSAVDNNPVALRAQIGAIKYCEDFEKIMEEWYLQGLEENKNMLKSKEQVFLFSLGSGYEQYLDRKLIIYDLRLKFKNIGYELSENRKPVLTKIKTGEQWAIKDADKMRAYIIIKEGNVFNVYYSTEAYIPLMTQKQKNFLRWNQVIAREREECNKLALVAAEKEKEDKDNESVISKYFKSIAGFDIKAWYWILVALLAVSVIISALFGAAGVKVGGAIKSLIILFIFAALAYSFIWGGLRKELKLPKEFKKPFKSYEYTDWKKNVIILPRNAWVPVNHFFHACMSYDLMNSNFGDYVVKYNDGIINDYKIRRDADKNGIWPIPNKIMRITGNDKFIIWTRNIINCDN